MNICIIDKAPSRNDYSKYFDFKFEVYHMSSVPITKLLKKDVTLDIDLDLYDLAILVGSEAAKHYAKITSVTNYAGQLVDDKFVCINNPAILIFKPEGKNDFEKSIERVKEYAAGKKADKATGDYGGIDDVRDAKEYLLEVLNNAEVFVAMDTEGTALYPRDGYVLGFSISYKVKQGRYILTDVLDDDNLAIIQQIIDKYEIVLHNMKYDIKMIEYHTNLRFRRDHVHDTMLMHYALDENGQHGLKLLALKYTDFGDYDAALEEFKVQYCKLHGMLQENFTYDLIPFDIMWPYASMDTAVTLELCYKFLPLIRANTKLSYVYDKLLLPGTLFLNDVEEVGIPIHKGRMQAAEVHLDEEILKAKEYLYTFDDLHRFEKDQADVFNPGSVVQLRKLLFDYIGLTPTGKLTKGGAVSTDAEVLEELSDEHPLPKAILNIRQLTKRKNTYISKILPELDRDSRIRTNFNMIFTTSGRLSSSGKFNAQQIERDDPLVKGCIHAPEGYSIVSQDLSTGEVYYAAVLSGDLALQQVFKDGGDFHSAIAKSVFDLTCEVKDVKKLYAALRQSAKAIK